jgi:NADH-quinone oxidoreductase subunit M
MMELHFAWLKIVILIPLVGALVVARTRNLEVAWKRSVLVTGIVLMLTLGTWADFTAAGAGTAHDTAASAMPWLDAAFAIDQINAPLLPLAALLYLVVTLTTLRTKIRRFSFTWNLISLSLLLALLSCRSPWGIVALSIAQTIPPAIELSMRGRSTRIFILYMASFAACLVAGVALADFDRDPAMQPALAVGLIAAAVLIRNAALPVHGWLADLFESAGFGTSLLFVTPMTGAYIAVRLLLPIGPDWSLRAVAVVSLATASYAAGLALVQQDVRRFFAYLFLSNASLVLVGMEVASPTSLTGSLALWLSVGISLTGLGLTLRAVESRCERLSLRYYHGLYEHMPTLAAFYLLTALASIGFPGTIGFVGAELLVESTVAWMPLVGVVVVLTGAINGMAVMRVYYRVYTGAQHSSSISLEARWPEKLAVLAMSLLILGGGILPQPGITSRYRAATEILSKREAARVPLNTQDVARAVEPASHSPTF